MARAGTAWIEFSGDFSRLQRQTQQAVSQSERAFKKADVGSSLSRGVGVAMREVGRTIEVGMGVAATAAAGLAAQAAKAGYEYNTLGQRATAAMTTVLGSGEKATGMMRELMTFASKSPFPRQAFIEASQQMLAFGFAAKDVIPTLSAVQDAVAASGGGAQQLKEVTFVLSQIQAAGKITGQDLMQLGQRGINAADLIGQSLGKSGQQIKQDITNGTLDADVAIKALTEGMTKRFGGASANLKNTWVGTMDTLQGRLRDFGAAFIQPFVGFTGGGALVRGIGAINKALKEMVGVGKDGSAQFKGALEPLNRIAANLATNVERALKTIAGWISRIDLSRLEGMRSTFSSMGPIVAAVGTAFSARFAGSIPILGQFLGGINPIVAAIGALIAASPGLRQALVPVLQALAGMFGTLMKAALPIVNVLINILTATVAQLAPVFTQLVQAIQLVIVAFGGALMQVFQALQPVIPALAGAFAKIAAALAEGLISLLPALVPMIKAMAVAISAVSPVFVALSRAMATVVNAIPPQVLGVLVGGFLAFKLAARDTGKAAAGASGGMSALGSGVGGLRIPMSALVIAAAALSPVIVALGGTLKALEPAVSAVARAFASLPPPVLVALTVALGGLAVTMRGMKVAAAGIATIGAPFQAWTATMETAGKVAGFLESGLAIMASRMGVTTAATAANTAAEEANLSVKQAGLVTTIRQGVVSAAVAVKNAVVTAATWAWTTAQTALNVAMMANPIGIVILAIAGLIAAIAAIVVGIIALIKNWRSVWGAMKTAFEASVGAIKTGINWIVGAAGSIWGAFKAVGAWLTASWPRMVRIALLVFLPFIGIPIQIIRNWSAIKGFFIGLWNTVKNAAVAAFNAVIGWATTVPGAITAAWASIKQFFVDLWNTVSSAVVTAFNAVMGFATTLPGRVWGAITSAFTAVVSFFSQLPGQIWTFLQQIPAFFSALPGKIIEALTGASQLLFNAGGNMMTGLVDGIVSGAEAVWQFFRDLPGKILEFFSDVGQWLLDVGKKIIWGSGLLGGIIEGAKGLWAWFAALPGKIISALGDAAKWLVDTGKKVITGLKDGWIAANGQAMNWMRGVAGRVVGAVGNAAKWLFNKGKDVITGLKNGWINANAQAMQWIRGIAGRVIGAVGNAGKWLFQKGRDVLNGMLGGLKSIAGSVWGWIKGIPNQIKNNVGNLGRVLFSAGRDVLNGLWNGIKSMGNWIKDQVIGLVKDIIPGPVKKILKIKSPSEVMMGLGEEIGRGLAAGITNTVDVITAAATAAAEAATIQPPEAIVPEVVPPSVAAAVTAPMVRPVTPTAAAGALGAAPGAPGAAPGALGAQVLAAPLAPLGDLAEQAGQAGTDAATALQTELAKGYDASAARAVKFVTDHGIQLKLARTTAATETSGLRIKTVDDFTRLGNDATRQTRQMTQGVTTSYRQLSNAIGNASSQLRRVSTVDFTGMQQAAVRSTTQLRDRTVENFRTTQRGATQQTNQLRDNTTRSTNQARDRMSQATNQARASVVSNLTNAQKGATSQAEKMRFNTTWSANQMRDRMTKASEGTKTGVVQDFNQMGTGVKGGLNIIERILNSALSSLGVKKVSFTAAQKKQKGGRLVGGQGTGDKIPALLEPGEVVWNRNAVRSVFGSAEQADLANKLWPRFQEGGALGQRRNYPRLSGDTDFLPKLGIALSKLAQAVGFPISVTSGYRSIAEQTALWNRSDKSGKMVAAPGRSRHGFGDAADISPQRSAYRGMEGRFGLYFPMSYEPWHIQIKDGGGAGGMAGIVEPLAKVVLNGPAGALRDLGRGAIDKAHQAAQKYLDTQSVAADSFGMIGNPSSAPGTLSAGQFTTIARKALELTGKFPATSGNISALLSRAMQESGLNPRAINNWDSNARAGDPSRGLMQTIGGTFSRYHQPGTSNNIYDPLANVAAAINYMADRYHRIVGATGAGYQTGGIAKAQARLKELQKNPKQNAAEIKKVQANIARMKKLYAEQQKKKAALQRANWLTKRLKNIQSLGVLPERLRLDIAGQSQWAEIRADWASRAEQLTTDPSDEGLEDMPTVAAAQAEYLRRYNAGLGIVFGGTQRHWLEMRLQSLFNLRNSLIRARELMIEALKKIADQLLKARKRLAEVNKKWEEGERNRKNTEAQIATVEKNLKTWRDQLKRVNTRTVAGRRQAATLKTRIANAEKNRTNLKSKLATIKDNQKKRVQEKNEINKQIIPALQGRQKDSTEARDEFMKRIDDVHGLGSPLNRMTQLPALGVLGGQIFATQMQLRELVPPTWTGTLKEATGTASDTSAGDTGETADDSERARLLEQLLREANLRTAVAERQFEVLRDWPPFGGAFQAGGVVPGPTGAARTAIVHGGERITPVGSEPIVVQVIVEDGAVDTRRIRAIAQGEAQVVTRRQAIAGGRILPGGGGG